MDALEQRRIDDGEVREAGELREDGEDGEAGRGADPAFDIDLDPDDQGSADAGAANPD